MPHESASSVVIRGIDARTFTEMESFVKDLEARPVERLLRDLPELADLPLTKVSLVSYVIAAQVPRRRAGGDASACARAWRTRSRSCRRER